MKYDAKAKAMWLIFRKSFEEKAKTEKLKGVGHLLG